MTPLFRSARKDAQIILLTLAKRLETGKDAAQYLHAAETAIDMLCVLAGRKNYLPAMGLVDHLKAKPSELSPQTAVMIEKFLREIDFLIDAQIRAWAPDLTYKSPRLRAFIRISHTLLMQSKPQPITKLRRQI